MMSRRAARELALRMLFEMDFTKHTPDTLLECLTSERFSELKAEDELYTELPDEKQKEYIAMLLEGVYRHCDELDDLIKKYAIGWSIGRIARITVCILRLCFFEIRYLDDVPPASAIDEAVEFAKRYDSIETGSFVNGILGSYMRDPQTEKGVQE